MYSPPPEKPWRRLPLTVKRATDVGPFRSRGPSHITDCQGPGDTTSSTTNRNNNSNERSLPSNSSETWAETRCRLQPKPSSKGWRSNRLPSAYLLGTGCWLMCNTKSELFIWKRGKKKKLVPSERRGLAYWFLGKQPESIITRWKGHNQTLPDDLCS